MLCSKFNALSSSANILKIGLRFDKVTQSLKVGTFFETQCRELACEILFCAVKLYSMIIIMTVCLSVVCILLYYTKFGYVNPSKRSRISWLLLKVFSAIQV